MYTFASVSLEKKKIESGICLTKTIEGKTIRQRSEDAVMSASWTHGMKYYYIAKYFNPEYVKWGNFTITRYGRRSLYYLNVERHIEDSWGNNVTIQFNFFERMSNEYRPSFVQWKWKSCDGILNEPYTGHLLARGGLANKTCPYPADEMKTLRCKHLNDYQKEVKHAIYLSLLAATFHTGESSRALDFITASRLTAGHAPSCPERRQADGELRSGTLNGCGGKDLKYLQTLKEKYEKRPIVHSIFSSMSEFNDDGLRASYNIPLLIAKFGKPHTIGEQLILSAVEEVVHPLHMCVAYILIGEAWPCTFAFTCIGVVVAGLLHPATGAGTGVSLWLVSGHLLAMDTAPTGLDKATDSVLFGCSAGADRHARCPYRATHERARFIAHTHNRQVEGAPGMSSSNRRGLGEEADPAAHVVRRPATASIVHSGSLHTAQAAHAADRRPSNVSGPPTAGQGSTHR
ncbi:hypothetical protein EVAR_27334_1 [Eumeta japonica]|uniref:Uncharacterized protein n=1 Tax=Eumeta variegata TaxID=151549 RepID=A0A4C1UDA2_EUMVA|nr:hypothetical protein EVAR_27334_1 [Eumeta japonica]